MKKPLLIIILMAVIFISACTLNSKYYSDEKYCERNKDCTLRENCCNSCYKDYVNIYHKEKLSPEECPINVCAQICPSPDSFSEPVCINNQCSPAITTN